MVRAAPPPAYELQPLDKPALRGRHGEGNSVGQRTPRRHVPQLHVGHAHTTGAPLSPRARKAGRERTDYAQESERGKEGGGAILVRGCCEQ
eukprot:264996-Chlamydomonas_euryale.AAC.6